MATRIYGCSVGDKFTDVTEGVGSATASKNVELTVDIANTIVNATSGTRIISKEELLECLEKIKSKIIADNWPPA